jgi:DNA-binding Lrp family transcriptional regulator
MAGRRPVTAEDIAIALGASPASIKRRLGRLLEGGILAAVEHAGKTYYQPVS